VSKGAQQPTQRAPLGAQSRAALAIRITDFSLPK
jgi:hypothetical protein